MLSAPLPCRGELHLGSHPLLEQESWQEQACSPLSLRDEQEQTGRSRLFKGQGIASASRNPFQTRSSLCCLLPQPILLLCT